MFESDCSWSQHVWRSVYSRPAVSASGATCDGCKLSTSYQVRTFPGSAAGHARQVISGVNIVADCLAMPSMDSTSSTMVERNATDQARKGGKKDGKEVSKHDNRTLRYIKSSSEAEGINDHERWKFLHLNRNTAVRIEKSGQEA